MFALIENYQASSETQKEYCHRHQVALSTFSYWLSRYKGSQKEESSSSFVRYDRSQTISLSSGTELTFPNGLRVSGDLQECTPSFISLLTHLGQLEL